MLDGYHETYSVPSEQGTKNLGRLRCAFKGTKFTTSRSQRDIHKGWIFPHGDCRRDVVVKVLKSVSKEECAAEINALKFVQTALRNLAGVNVEVMPTFYAQVATLSTIKCFWTNKHHLNVIKGGYVLIQGRLPNHGQVEELWSVNMNTDQRKADGTCSRCRFQSGDLAKLADKIYRSFNEECAITSMRGVQVTESPEGAKPRMKYLLTGVTLHSVQKRFGSRDRGSEGIREFRAWAKQQESESSNDNSEGTVTESCTCVSVVDSESCANVSAVDSEFDRRLLPTAPPAEGDDVDLAHECDESISFGNENDQDTLAQQVAVDEHCVHELYPDLLALHGLEYLMRKAWGEPPPYSEACI